MARGRVTGRTYSICFAHVSYRAMDSPLDALPDVPTVGETLADYEVAAWTGIGVPKGTPPAIIEKLNREINSGLTNPKIRARLTELTTIPLVLTPKQFGSHMAAEIE